MALTLVASAARISSGNSGALANCKPERFSGGEFALNITAAATVAGDTLNVYVQHSMDGGTTWDDFVSFTQALGNGGAKNFMAGWTAVATAPAAMHAATDATLAAGSVNQGPNGDVWRIKWVIAGASPSFTFAVYFQANPAKDP